MHAVTEVIPLICSEGSNSVLPLLSDIQSADPAWYQLLVSQLTDEHKKDLEEVFRLADQKKAAAGLFHLLIALFGCFVNGQLAVFIRFTAKHFAQYR